MTHTKIENIAIISLILIGIGSGILFYLQGYKDLSGVMLSISLASILYKFLGGIDAKNTFTLGAIKFGGSTAVLAGFIYFLVKVIFVAEPTVQKVDISPADRWIPIDAYTGESIEVTISSADQEPVKYPVSPDEIAQRKQHRYQIIQNGDDADQMYVVLNSNQQNPETIGYVEFRDIQSDKLFSRVSVNDDDEMEVFTLYPYGDMNSTNKLNLDLPFEIKVFGTRFSIVYEGQETPLVSRKEVRRRTTRLVPGSDKGTHYLVITEQANHQYRGEERDKNFSKWIVMKMKTNLQ
ncbi:MAG: hypothetical protein AAFX87_03130 [Bacteroidota bacterium]